MQEYRPARSAEGSQSGVPSWLLEEQQQQQQRQQMAAQAHTPPKDRRAMTSTEGTSTYAGLSGSPDTRRAYYTSNHTVNRHNQLREQRHQRQQQQQQMASAQPLELRTRPQHQAAVDSVHLQRMPASEPIYMDIDPSIHQPMSTAAADAAGHRSAMVTTTTTTTASRNDMPEMGVGPTAASHTAVNKSPSRLRSLNCTTSVPTTTEVRPRTPPLAAARPPSRSSMSSYSNSHSNSQSHSNHSSPSPSYVNRSHHSINTTNTANNKSLNSTGASSNGGQSRGNHYTYVNPYVSPIARDYRVPGGMFPHQPGNAHNISTSTSSSSARHYNTKPSPYNDTPIGPDKHGLQQHQQSLIMFGDDYDLGSINTGMSQQELLKKRRDVKKRREGKYGTKKKTKSNKSKAKERIGIINMPPRMLSMGSWDTSPITKLTSRDNSHHTPYKDNNSEEQKKQGQWNINIMRGFTPPGEEESTDLSTRESGDPHDPALATTAGQQQTGRALPSSDNISLSSFPLLSTNAKEGLATEETRMRPEATVHYVQPGNIPQIKMQHRVAIQPQHNLHDQQQQRHPPQQPQYQESQPAQYQQPQHPPQHQSHSPSRPPRPQHMDIYQRQHSAELQQLEHHLHYLQEQHHQLEQEIQERQRQQQVEGPGMPTTTAYEDDRPRSVHFASKIAQDIEEGYEAPSDESTSRIHKDSPTSVAQLNENSNDQDKSNTSVIAPKALFSQPRSILRRKGQQPLDSTGRYPGANRGRSHAPLFTDSTGREVSPIRSPGRQRAQQGTTYQMQPNAAGEDVGSIPDNPDDKDIAVLFDSDPDADNGFLKREFDDDSGLISDAFIEAVAAIVLQTAIRRFLAIRRTQKLRLGQSSLESHRGRNSHQGAIPSPGRKEQGADVNPMTQAAMNPVHKHVDQGNEMAQEDFFYDLAAIQIQCVFRGWWVRDSIAVDKYCATLIQKSVRGYRARLEYDYELYRIILVQSIWRQKLALRATRTKTLSPKRSESVRNKNEKARMQQKLQQKQQRLRAKPPQREFLQPSTAEEAGIWQVAAIIIQTYWRSYVSRICYLQSVSDVVVVQSVARRWLTRRWLGKCMASSAQRNNQWATTTVSRPHSRQSSTPLRGGGRFAKFGSFESRNLSSLGADESMGSSNRKMSSLDESVPSVPFRILADDDPEQPPSLTPPRKGKNYQVQQQPGHFEDPSRFGGSKNCWKGYDRGSSTAQSSISYNQPAVTNSVNGSHTPARSVGNQHGDQLLPTANSAAGSPGSAKEVPRSKGWNAQEEIDKEGTRNLLMAWKQKDKANSFTIRPRNGYS